MPPEIAQGAKAPLHPRPARRHPTGDIRSGAPDRRAAFARPMRCCARCARALAACASLLRQAVATPYAPPDVKKLDIANREKGEPIRGIDGPECPYRQIERANQAFPNYQSTYTT